MLFYYTYTDSKDRKRKIVEAESKGQRMLHDNFDADWKPGDEPHGVMIFTDAPELIMSTRDLAREIDELKVTIENIKTKLEMK